MSVKAQNVFRICFPAITAGMTITDAVADEVKARQSRPLEPIYPIVYLDCIHVKVRDTGAVRVKAVYLAIDINLNGERDVLGLWIAQTDGPSSGCRWSPI